MNLVESLSTKAPSVPKKSNSRDENTVTQGEQACQIKAVNKTSTQSVSQKRNGASQKSAIQSRQAGPDQDRSSRGGEGWIPANRRIDATVQGQEEVVPSRHELSYRVSRSAKKKNNTTEPKVNVSAVPPAVQGRQGWRSLRWQTVLRCGIE